jgi:hypothetical protein
LYELNREWQEFGRFARLMSALTAQEINLGHLGVEIGMTGNGELVISCRFIMILPEFENMRMPGLMRSARNGTMAVVALPHATMSVPSRSRKSCSMKW